MKIAFIGDSFCAAGIPESWTSILSASLGAKRICKGREGSNIWDAHKQLIQQVNSADVICFCHTDRHRLPNRHNWPINAGSVELFRDGNTENPHSVKNFPDVRIWEAADLYYQHIYDDGYHMLAQRLIINDMGNIAADNGKYAVHMFCFDDPLMQFPNSSTLDISLIKWLKLCGKDSVSMDPDHNHMSAGMNAHVAQKVYDQIINQHQGKFSLDIIPYRQ